MKLVVQSWEEGVCLQSNLTSKCRLLPSGQALVLSQVMFNVPVTKITGSAYAWHPRTLPLMLWKTERLYMPTD